MIDRQAAWAIGLLLGALDGLLAAELPVMGLVLLGLGVALNARTPTRLAGIGGLLLGFGGLWFLVLWNAMVRCAAFDALPDQGCSMPSVTGFLVIAAVPMVAGIGLTVLAIRGGSRRGPR